MEKRIISNVRQKENFIQEKVRVLILFSFLFFTFAELYAQQSSGFKQTVRGTVIDEDTKSPIIGAHVIILNTNPSLGSVTDVKGKFKIENIPVGRHTIQISFLGYKSKAIQNQLIGSGKELILNIELTESAITMEAVTITGGSGNKSDAVNEMAMVSARSFAVEQTRRFAAGASDPARMITAYAGVIGNGGDDQNAIIIRGNSPRGLLWRLEGVEIPNPNHFAPSGASSGGISILSANTLSNSDFYTGAFPAEFGNALSGAFDIKLRNGNNEKREYTFQAGILGLETALEGPFKKEGGSSYLINYRYSTLSLFNKLGINIVSKDDVTTYQDAAFKFHFPTKKAGVFSFFGIGGLSENDYKRNGDTYTENIKTGMGVVGLSHLFRLNNKSFLKSTLSLSGKRIKNNALNTDPANKYQLNENKRKTYARLATKLRTKFNARHILETGIIYSRLAYHFTERIIDAEEEPPFNDYEYINEKGNAGSMQAYASWKYKITDDLSFINGLHLLYFGLNKKVTVEPRSALKWQFSPKQSVSIGFGMHSRIESLEFYLAKYVDENGVSSQPNTGLDFTKARHYVLGYDNLLNENWYFKAETYLQKLYNVPVHKDENSLFSTLLLEEGFTAQPLVNKGTGTNYGLELTVQRFFNKDFYLLFSGSVYEANYKVLDGKERNTPFGSNFGFNLLSGKEFKVGKNKQNLIGLNFRASWGGNRRYIPIDLESSKISNTEVLNYNLAYDKRLPDYWKFDFQLSYYLNRKNLTHEFRIDILNVTNHENVASQSYNPATQQLEYDKQTGIIPAITYRIEF